jgi:hypothetical protein
VDEGEIAVNVGEALVVPPVFPLPAFPPEPEPPHAVAPSTTNADKQNEQIRPMNILVLPRNPRRFYRMKTAGGISEMHPIRHK